jgi:hypothetical protein
MWSAADSVKPLLFGLLAGGSGMVLFGETAGLVLAVGIGALAGCVSQGLVGSGVGGLMGAKSMAVGHLLSGSMALPALYAVALGLAVICFMNSVHATWREGMARGHAGDYFWTTGRVDKARKVASCSC